MLPAPFSPKERRSRDAAPRAGSLAMTQTTKQVSFRAIYEARLLRAPKGATGRQARTFPVMGTGSSRPAGIPAAGRGGPGMGVVGPAPRPREHHPLL